MNAYTLSLLLVATVSQGFRLNCGGGSLNGGAVVGDSESYYGTTDLYRGTAEKIEHGQTLYVYSSYAYGKELKYSVPAPKGKLTLKLRFAELYTPAAKKGGRVFSIFVNDKLAASNVDVYAKVGFQNPLVITKENVFADDGRVFIRIEGITGNGIINGIDLVKAKSKVPKITWKRMFPNYPKPVFEAQGTVLGDGTKKFLVVIGGFNKYPRSTREVWQLPLSGKNREWTRLANMPKKLTHMAQSYGRDEICGAGGYRGPKAPGRSTSHVYCFHRGMNKWRTLKSLPGNRAGGGLLRVRTGSEHYFLYAGGVDRVHDSLEKHIDYGTTWKLDLKVQGATWKNIGSNMPDPRNHMGAVQSCGRYFFIGGQYKQDEERGNRVTVNEWLPKSGTWSKNPPAPLPLPLGHISASVLPYKCGIFIVGGITNGKKRVAHTLYWESSSNKWHFVDKYPIDVATPVCGMDKDEIWCATGAAKTKHNVYRGTISF